MPKPSQTSLGRRRLLRILRTLYACAKVKLINKDLTTARPNPYTWPQKLDHELWCIMDQLTKLVEGQFHGQETTPTHDSLQVPYRAGSAWRHQDSQANTLQNTISMPTRFELENDTSSFEGPAPSSPAWTGPASSTPKNPPNKRKRTPRNPPKKRKPVDLDRPGSTYIDLDRFCTTPLNCPIICAKLK